MLNVIVFVGLVSLVIGLLWRYEGRAHPEYDRVDSGR